MTPDSIIRITREALLLVLILSAPPMLASLIVGLTVSIIQATTQIQEQTLGMVPKIVTVFLVIGIAGPWMLQQVIRFTTVMLDSIATVR